MFFEPLETRSMCSSTIPNLHPNLSIKPPQLPSSLVMSAKPGTSAAHPIARVSAAAKAKKLVDAALASGLNLLSDVFAGKLQNLVVDVSDFKAKAAKAGDKLQQLLGSTVVATASIPTSQLDAARGASGSRDHLSELIGKPKISGDHNSQVSEGDSDNKGILDAIISFFTPSSAESAGKNAANYGADVVLEKYGPPGGGEAVTLLRGPSIVQSVTGDARDLLNGVLAVFQSGDKDPRMPDQNGNTRTPLPDDVANTTTHVITVQDIRSLLAKLNAASQPTGEESSGTGGPLNTGASGTGKLGSQGHFTDESVASTTIELTARQLTALQIRLTSHINVTH